MARRFAPSKPTKEMPSRKGGLFVVAYNMRDVQATLNAIELYESTPRRLNRRCHHAWQSGNQQNVPEKDRSRHHRRRRREEISRGAAIQPRKRNPTIISASICISDIDKSRITTSEKNGKKYYQITPSTIGIPNTATASSSRTFPRRNAKAAPRGKIIGNWKWRSNLSPTGRSPQSRKPPPSLSDPRTSTKESHSDEQHST